MPISSRALGVAAIVGGLGTLTALAAFSVHTSARRRFPHQVAEASFDALQVTADAVAAKAEQAASTLEAAPALARGWMEILLRKTSEHEGRFWSVNRNWDGHGVSFGILQWTQRGGALGTLLSAMRRADPARFDAIFGGTSAALALLAHVGRRDLGPLLGKLLWDEPWLSSFVTAGRDPVFQKAQVDLARTGDHMRAALAVVRILGITPTERALTLAFNRTVHQGVGGATSIANNLSSFYTNSPGMRPKSERQVLAEYAWSCADRFRTTTRPTSDRYNATIRWVELPVGARELDLGPTGSLLVRPTQVPTWHGVTGSGKNAVDLYDLILCRSANPGVGELGQVCRAGGVRTPGILVASDLRDVQVDLSEISRAVA